MPKIYAVATLQATPSGGNSQDLNLFKTESSTVQSIKKALTDFAQDTYLPGGVKLTDDMLERIMQAASLTELVHAFLVDPVPADVPLDAPPFNACHAKPVTDDNITLTFFVENEIDVTWLIKSIETA